MSLVLCHWSLVLGHWSLGEGGWELQSLLPLFVVTTSVVTRDLASAKSRTLRLYGDWGSYRPSRVMASGITGASWDFSTCLGHWMLCLHRGVTWLKPSNAETTEVGTLNGGRNN